MCGDHTHDGGDMEDPLSVCECGHMGDEHGNDPDYPGSTSCGVEGCDCIAFENLE